MVNAFEPALGGQKVYIDQNANFQFDPGDTSVVTDANGHYIFTGLQQGYYVVLPALPAGFSETFGAGSPYLFVGTGQNLTGENIGIASDNAGSIQGIVFGDSNANGTIDIGEAGISGVRVYLDANNNGVYDSNEVSMLTDLGGDYMFGPLAPGNYVVREVIPAGKRLVSPSSGSYTVQIQLTLGVYGQDFANA
jgi:hypothetical protein